MARKMPWLKLYTEIVDDEKLADFTGDEFRAFVYLLCLARESSVPGTIGLSLQRIAWRTRIPIPVLMSTLAKGEERDMLAVTKRDMSRDVTRDFRDMNVTAADSAVTVTPEILAVTFSNWMSRQGDKPSDSAEQTRERQRRSRAKKAAEMAGVGVTVTTPSRVSRPLEVEVEEEEEEDSLPKPSPQGHAARALEVNPEPSSDLGIGQIAEAYEKQQRTLLAGRELLDVRHWIARGVKPQRFVEAIEVVGKAMRLPNGERPLSFWKAVLASIRDTPQGEPIEWRSRPDASKPKPKPQPHNPYSKA